MDNITEMGYLVDAGNLRIRLRCHDDTIRTIDTPEKPYFFVARDNLKVATYYARKVAGRSATFYDTDLLTIEGNPVVKVECDYPRQVGQIRRLMPKGMALEADIPFERRVRFDAGWHTSDVYNVGFFDLETATTTFGGFTEGSVIAASVVGNGFSECMVGDERSVMTFLHNIITSKKVELLVGYNSDLFDVPLMQERLPRYGLTIAGLRYLDLYRLIRQNSQRQLSSWTLEHVVNTLLGTRRVNADRPVHKLTRQEIHDRCLADSDLLWQIEKRYGYVDTAITKAHYANIFPDETVFASRVVDALLLQKARKLGYVLPSKPEYTETTKHSGAYILQPPEALKVYQNVLVLDVASMYPSIIMQFGLSPDRNHELIPSVLRELYNERLRLKVLAKKGDVRANIKQNALKVILNATYGVMSNPAFRLFDPGLGDAVATYGRQINGIMRDSCKLIGLDVIASDTDSVFVVMPDISADPFEPLARVIELQVERTLGVKVTIEPDKFYSKLYFPKAMSGDRASKKKYAGLVVWTKGKGWINPELEIMGMETVRSDWPDAIKLLQRAIVALYLSGDANGIRNLYSEFRKGLEEGSIPPESLSLSKGYNKTDYKVKPPHIRAAERSGQKYVIGDKIRYVYTIKGPEPLETGYTISSIDASYYLRLAEGMMERCVGTSYGRTLDDYT